MVPKVARLEGVHCNVGKKNYKGFYLKATKNIFWESSFPIAVGLNMHHHCLMTVDRYRISMMMDG